MHIKRFWDAQDAACHVIIMTMHHFGMATHQCLSYVAIVGYSAVSYDNHMQATWRESDWCVDIQKQAPESAQCVSDLSFFRRWGDWGLGTKLFS